MNKYQMSLDRLFMWATNGYCALKMDSEEYFQIKSNLQELVDKATPKKVKGIKVKGISETYEYKVGNCPCCNRFVRLLSDKPYICECGQKLEWSNENEQGTV